MPSAVLKVDHYNLKNVAITLNSGVVLDCTSITFSYGIQITDRTAGNSLKEQRVINKAMAPKISIEGFNSSKLGYADLKPGTKISAFTVVPTLANDGATFLQSDFFTTWPVSEMYLGETSTGLNEGDSSKWTTAIECGIIYSALAPPTIPA